MNDEPPVRRRIVGAALRRFREGAGLGLDDAARILDCDRSKISRIETGQRGIRPKELRELLVEYGAEQGQWDAFEAIARQNMRRGGWWQSYNHVLEDAHRDYIILESTAEAIWNYQPQVVPGLLQTADYARALAATSPVFENRQDQDQFVKARLARQQLLTRENPLRLWVIISETALRQMVGGPEVMRAQLQKLGQVAADLPNVTVQVMPFAVGAHAAGSSGPFGILKFPDAPNLGVVYLEAQTGGVYLEEADQVARYNLVYEHLRASALAKAATARLIREVAESYDASTARQPRRL